jgi:hypothetical protein
MYVVTLCYSLCGDTPNATTQGQNAENFKQIFPEKEYRGLSPNFHFHVSVSELYIPTMGLPVLLEEICRLILGIYTIAQRHMNVEIGAEAALFPEKEYINGIAVAVTTGGVLLWLCTARGSKETKKKLLQIISDSPPVVTATRAQWEYRHMGCSTMSQRTSEFLLAHSTSKETQPF